MSAARIAEPLVPARPWLPWLALGLVVGALAPGAAGAAVARLGPHLSPLALWWVAGAPVALVAVAAASRLPHAARWLGFGAAALAGSAWAAAGAGAGPSAATLASVRGEVRTVAWSSFTQGLVVAGADGRLFVRAPGAPGVEVGDVVAARGALVADPRGPALDAVELELLVPRERGPRAWAWAALARVRERRELAGTLLLGAGRPPERDDFRASGLAHVLAVSGMHLVIAAALGNWLLRAFGLPWAWRMGASAALVLGYLWLTGGGSATARAAAMSIAVLAAGAGGRDLHRLAPVAASAAVLVVVDPAVAGDIGFQLSLAAVLGIVTLGLALVRLRHRLAPLAPWPLDRPVWRGLLWLVRTGADGVAIGVAATLATAPLVAWHFATANPWSAVATLAATPTATAALWLGLPCLALAGAWPGRPWEGLYRALELDLDALATTAAACARLPGASLAVAPPPAWLLCCWPALFALPALARACREALARGWKAVPARAMAFDSDLPEANHRRR